MQLQLLLIAWNMWLAAEFMLALPNSMLLSNTTCDLSRIHLNNRTMSK